MNICGGKRENGAIYHKKFSENKSAWDAMDSGQRVFRDHETHKKLGAAKLYLPRSVRQRQKEGVNAN